MKPIWQQPTKFLKIQKKLGKNCRSIERGMKYSASQYTEAIDFMEQVIGLTVSF